METISVRPWPSMNDLTLVADFHEIWYCSSLQKGVEMSFTKISERHRTLFQPVNEIFRFPLALCRWTIMRFAKKCVYIYIGCPRMNVPDFGRVFLMLKYTDITQNTYVQSWTVTEIMAREVWNFDSCYTHVDYQIHIKLAGICGFCNVNICTSHQTNLWVT